MIASNPATAGRILVLMRNKFYKILKRNNEKKFTVHNETKTNVVPAPNVPIVPVEILVNASINGNPNYQPDNITAEKAT